MKKEYLKRITEKSRGISDIINRECKEDIISIIRNRKISYVFEFLFKELYSSIIERKNKLSISIFKFLIILKTTTDNEIKLSNSHIDIMRMFRYYLIEKNLKIKDYLLIIDNLKDTLSCYLRDNYKKILEKYDYKLVYITKDDITSLNENNIIQEYKHIMVSSSYEIALDLSEIYFSVGFDSENIYKIFINILLSAGKFIKLSEISKSLQKSKNKETRLFATEIIKDNKNNIYKEEIFEKCKILLENYKITEAKNLINNEIKKNGSNYVFQSLLSSIAFLDVSTNKKNKEYDFLEKIKISQTYFDNYLDLVEEEI